MSHRKPKFQLPEIWRDQPTLARLFARAVGSKDRRNKTPRASFKPWMKRRDYIIGAKNWDGGFRGCRSGISKWSKRMWRRHCKAQDRKKLKQ